MYQLIIFDWDGTIMDSAQKIANCIKASAHDVGLQVPTTQQAKQVIGLGLSEAMRLVFPQAKSKQINALIEAYRYHFVTGDDTQQGLFPKVEHGLQKLEEAGALLAVATGKSRVGLDRAFTVSGLRPRFVTSRCADETRSKPHPQMLHEILEFTALEPHQAIMVGDTSYDMDMAANAAMAAAGVSYGVHTKTELLNSGAGSVHHSFIDCVDWLLDGRIERAHTESKVDG